MKTWTVKLVETFEENGSSFEEITVGKGNTLANAVHDFNLSKNEHPQIVPTPYIPAPFRVYAPHYHWL